MNILEQNEKKINGKLETFDRMIINGYLRSLYIQGQFLYYLNQNNIKLVDFDKFAEQQTASLCNHINTFIKENNVELQYLNSGKISKDELARKQLLLSENKTGLIAAFSTVELCKTMTVKPNHNKKILEPVPRNTKCKHYYLYFNDEEFGWMFLKIQTWFPYNVQIYINGREYLSKIFDKENIKYEMYNNSFSYIENFERAQELADSILNKKISDSFDGLVNKINNLLPNIKEKLNCSYYWCIDQCEFATDINFKSCKDLNIFYKKLVETTYFTFSSEDIYSFFGRNVKHINKFKGEIVSDLRNRDQGFRIKFKINSNQIKMYNKGNNLRIEVTINNPKDFKILKEKDRIIDHEKLVKEKKWVPMGKSIANLYRYVEISKSISSRYIEALPTVNLNNISLEDLENISESKEIDGRKYSGFNILNKDTLKIFQEISKGEYLINGFTNKKIRKNLYNDPNNLKNINRVTRLLSKLKAHGLIKKVANKNKYYVTTHGRNMISNLMLYTKREIFN